MALDVVSKGQGIALGQSPTDLVAIFGQQTAGLQTATGVAQPSGGAQAAISRGLAAGTIATYVSTQSPSAVAANTAAEQNFTIQTGTGATMLLATGDALYLNKPTAQAGLGYGNVRVGSANTAAVNFNNFSGGSVTPTASQAYSLVAIRGLPAITVTITPAAVAATSIVEQTFTCTGLPAGALVQVVKPTAQAGLDIVGVRAVSDNLVGITFANPTASPITPTAAEAYVVTYMFGLDAANSDVVFGYNAGTIGAIGVGVVVTGAPITFTGALATDVPVGPPIGPTAQAAATNAAFPVKQIITANTLTAYFAGIGSGATPTASEVYNQKVHRANPAAPLLLYSQSLAPTSVAANTTAEQTFTVTGLISGTPVWVNKPTATGGLGIVGVRVSATNTLAITYANVTASAIVPPTEAYLIGNFQTPTPGAGNVVYQTVLAALDKAGTLANALRAALLSLRGIAGA